MEWDADKARSMLEAGMQKKDVAAYFGITHTTLKCRLSPAYREERRQQAQYRRHHRCIHLPRVTEVLLRSLGGGPDEVPPVPADTRSITGRICGDPLPGRSALDARMQS